MVVTYYFVSGAYVSFHYSDDDFGSSCQNISPSQDYTHLDDQTTLLQIIFPFFHQPNLLGIVICF